MPFADVAGCEARRLQPLSDRRHIDVRCHVVPEHAIAMWIQPREQSRPCWPAHRGARVRGVEPDAASREAIDLGRAQREIRPVAPDTVRALCIDEEEDGLAFRHGGMSLRY